MFQIESIRDNTVTVRYGVLTFKVYVHANGFIEFPKKYIYISPEYRYGLINQVKTAYFAVQSNRSNEYNESCRERA